MRSATPLRVTPVILSILEVLMDSDVPLHSSQIAHRMKADAGSSLYAMLDRMCATEWVTSAKTPETEKVMKFSGSRHYRMTDRGRVKASKKFAEQEAEKSQVQSD